MSHPRKTLVFLSGPPAVGKMTVGREIARLTGMPLFHNHLSIDAVLPVFGFGADLDTRIERNESASRLKAKPSKGDVEASRRHLLDVESRHRLTSDGQFPLSPHLLIDNANLEPAEVAERIVGHFELPRLGEDGVPTPPIPASP